MTGPALKSVMRIELTVRIASRTRIPEGVMTGQESGRSRLERPGLVCKLVVAALAFAFLAYVAQRGARRASDFKYVYGAARFVWTTGALNVRAQARYPVTFHVLLAPWRPFRLAPPSPPGPCSPWRPSPRFPR